MEPFGEVLIFAGVANKTTVVSNWLPNQGTRILNHRVGNTSTLQKDFGNIATRKIDCINTERGGETMFDGLKSFYDSKITISKRRSCHFSVREIGSIEGSITKIHFPKVSSVQVGSAKVHMSEVNTTELTMTEICINEDSIANIANSKVRIPEIRFAEICSAEIRRDELRPSQA